MKKLIILSLLIFSAFTLTFSASTFADSKSAIQCGVNQAAGADCTAVPATGGVTQLVKDIINVLSVLAGATAVIMLMVGGFRYVTSAGSESGVAGAKKTIIYALAGLVVIAVAQVVVHFVLNNIT